MMRVRVKFCGISSVKDVENAITAGVDALGFIFFKKSPRFINPEEAEVIIKRIPPFITSVGVFVNEKLDIIEKCIRMCGLDAIQLHGDEDIPYCLKFKSLKLKGIKLIKAIRVRDKESVDSIKEYPVDAFLLDTYKPDKYGGTGEGFDRSLASKAKEYDKPLIMSGGLTPDNVCDIIKKIKPYAVDVSSGIESGTGNKSLKLMERFIQEVRKAERTFQ